MCGIAGALVFKDSSFKVSHAYLETMRDTMIHRGPDGAGTWLSDDRSVGLAHRRLSILDLSENANQPMSDDTGLLQIVFNGEIYNHAEIREELEKKGYTQWKTEHSDTEVLLRAFQVWGIDCLHRLRGMFAFAIWDERTKELWLVRDRIGIKPLYYSIHNGRLVFASEIKALLTDPDQKKAIHDEGVYHFLSFLTTPSPDSLFDGIKKLEAGVWLCIQANGQVKKHQYWDVLDNLKPMYGVSEEKIAENILEELEAAVQYRKVSDVPVGVFLSGGIDSSVNAALFSKGDKEVVKTFSIGYEGNGSYESYTNELEYAQMVANDLGADYHQKLLNLDDLINFLPKMVHLQDEPIADPVCMPVYYVSQLARDNGVTVCQVGEGADELFIGYPSWKKRFQAQQLNQLPVPGFLKKSALLAMGLTGKKSSFQYEYLRRACLGQPVQWSGAEAFTHHEKNRLISKRLKNNLSVASSWACLKPFHDKFHAQHYNPNPLDLMSYVDLKFRLPELLLMRVDKMSMGVSLEARVPFLDHKFVELAMSIPADLKLKNDSLKYMLKKAVRGQIPDEIIDRPKQGFGVPVEEWLLGRLGDHVQKELKLFCSETDLISWKEVDRLLNSKLRSKTWPLFNMALWWKEHFYA